MWLETPLYSRVKQTRRSLSPETLKPENPIAHQFALGSLGLSPLGNLVWRRWVSCALLLLQLNHGLRVEPIVNNNKLFKLEVAEIIYSIKQNLVESYLV